MKKLIPSILFLLLAFAASTLLAQGNAKRVVLYTDNFSGSQADFVAGSYNSMDLLKAGITVLRSAKIPAGIKVTIYENSDFSGKKLELTEDANMTYLKAKGFGQVAQNVSIIVAEVSQNISAITGPVVTLYKDNFSGTAKNLGAGHYEFIDFGDIGNDQLSSVKIPKGLKVTLYEHSESGGKSLVLTEDASASHLVANKFNDFTSSIYVEQLPEPKAPVVIVPVIRPQPTSPQPREEAPVQIVDDPANPMITIYQGNYSGLFKRFGPGRYNVDALGIGNNELSSIKIPVGLRVILYDQAGFLGKSITVSENVPADYFDAYEFNNLTSSLVVELIPRATIYQGNYIGEASSFEPGYYDVEELPIGNDELSSVKVLPGLWVLLFEHSDFTGRSLLITQDATTDFLGGREFDNLTSSMIVGKSSDPLPVVTLFQNDFVGAMKRLTPGEFPLLDVGNDAVSSVEIPRGLKVTLFAEPAYQGRAMTITQSTGTAFFRANEFNDITSSLIIEQIRPHDLVITIYASSFSGFAQDLTPGEYRSSDMSITGDISSIKVPPGMRATLYRNENFTGSHVIVDRNTDYTGSKTFDNLCQSIIVEDVWTPIVTPVNVPPIETAPVVTPIESPPSVVVETAVPCELTEKEFYSALKAVEGKAFSDEKMATARLATKDKCLSNEQIRAIARLFSFEEQTLEFVKYAYDLATEKSTYYTLDDVFKFMSSKDAFSKFLSSK